MVERSPRLGRRAEATIAVVESAVEGFIGDFPQADDVTILVVNRGGEPGRETRIWI